MHHRKLIIVLASYLSLLWLFCNAFYHPSYHSRADLVSSDEPGLALCLGTGLGVLPSEEANDDVTVAPLLVGTAEHDRLEIASSRPAELPILVRSVFAMYHRFFDIPPPVVS